MPFLRKKAHSSGSSSGWLILLLDGNFNTNFPSLQSRNHVSEPAPTLDFCISFRCSPYCFWRSVWNIIVYIFTLFSDFSRFQRHTSAWVAFPPTIMPGFPLKSIGPWKRCSPLGNFFILYLSTLITPCLHIRILGAPFNYSFYGYAHPPDLSLKCSYAKTKTGSTATIFRLP